jgi:hypothetical protein
MNRFYLLAILLAAGLLWVCEVRSEPKTVTYYLPLEYGDSRKVFQGNGGNLSHNTQWNRYAWDFSPMPEGTPVVAAADGVVTFVKQDTAGPTGNMADNNLVIIRHADGNVGEYLHIKQNGAVVKKNQKVMRGDLIAYSGNTGNSGGPHLHFNLRKGSHVTGVSVPCKFADVAGDGVPKKGDTVTSKNFPTRYQKECDEIEQTAVLYELCNEFRCLVVVVKKLKSFAKINIPMPLKILKATIKKRNDLLTQYEKAAGEALEAIASAKEAGDIKTAVRIVFFGEKDFSKSKKAADFKKAHVELKKDKGYKEAVGVLKAERDYRTKISKAIRNELKIEAKLKKGSKASYRNVIKSYEQALECLPEGDTAKALRKHITHLKSFK